MKKGLILFTALFLLSTFTAFAAVTAVKDGDVVKVTWTYENADAASVGLVGDFQGWNLAGALPMTKDANGKWTITLDGKADSEYKYKFNVDGEWTEDPTAPAGVDDGFGGTNGYAVAADLLAAAATGAAAAASAPASKGLIVGLYQATWLDAHALTQAPNDKTQKGLALDEVALRSKAYLKWDGALYPGLVTVTGEIKVFDGAVTAYRYVDVNNTTVTPVTWEQGGKALAMLPWTMFTSFNAPWPDLKGKLRTTVTLADLNTKISHSVGWSKTANQKIGAFWVSMFKDPDANGGITEIYSAKPFELGGAKLSYLVNFDYGSDIGKIRNLVTSTLTLDKLSVEFFSNLHTGQAAVADYAKTLQTRDVLGLSYALDALTLKAQGGIYTDGTAGKVLTDAYFGAASVGYTVKDMIDATVTFKYAGADAMTGLMDGDNKFDGKFKNQVALTYTIAPTLKAYLENNFSANYKKFDGIADDLIARVNFKDGIEVTPEVKVTLPLDTAKFAVNYFQVSSVVDKLTSIVRWEPNTDFTVNTVKLRAIYDLGNDMQLATGARLLLDSDNVTNPLGLTVGYSLKTPFEAVKSPYLFATANYNLDAMEGGDSSALELIDDGDFIRANDGASLRVGLRWNF